MYHVSALYRIVYFGALESVLCMKVVYVVSFIGSVLQGRFHCIWCGLLHTYLTLILCAEYLINSMYIRIYITVDGSSIPVGVSMYEIIVFGPLIDDNGI